MCSRTSFARIVENISRSILNFPSLVVMLCPQGTFVMSSTQSGFFSGWMSALIKSARQSFPDPRLSFGPVTLFESCAEGLEFLEVFFILWDGSSPALELHGSRRRSTLVVFQWMVGG